MNDSHVPSISVSTKQSDGRCYSNYNHGLEVVTVCYKGHCQMLETIKRGDCYSKRTSYSAYSGVLQGNFMYFLETVHSTSEQNSNMTTPTVFTLYFSVAL